MDSPHTSTNRQPGGGEQPGGAGTPRTYSRRPRVQGAAAFFSGPAELLEFVLPLAAAQVLGATPAQTGALLAVQFLVSLLVRPVAGVLVDRAGSERGTLLLAAAGAGCGGLSFGLYAAATTLPPAFAAAGLGGLGGAYFWVAVRAHIASRIDSGDDRFAALMESESSGAWIAFLAGIPLFQIAGAQAMFLACAASCFVAGVLLALTALTGSGRLTGTDRLVARPLTPVDARNLLRSLRRILVLAGVVAFAEGIVSLLLILHLIGQLGFDLGAIALVYLPGAIVLSIAPKPLHRRVRRVPPHRILLVGLGCSAVFAAALVVRPGPVAVAVLWILSALCFSLLVPLLERLVAEVSGGHAGRGFGWYQSADLLGSAAGALAAGLLFGAGLWEVATIGAGLLLVVSGVLGRRSLRSFAAVATAPEHTPPPQHHDQGKGLSPAMKRTATTLAVHLGIYAVAQIVFAVVAQSWPWEVITGGTSVTTLLTWNAEGSQLQRLVGSVSRIWTIVVLVDIVWSGYRMLVPKERTEPTEE
ncbi:MFS transporter [Brevibacterium casei]|uniref:Transporter, major facilitator family protein n=1 Tax=Brevibacterium casei S18 TaxID=1229781 RepID=K9AUI6_9MICO|nr:MFS transporter [Brevibacterium casei]EKU46247.1 transporter, major facilitator family protein [Brevibacterium casei S18]